MLSTALSTLYSFHSSVVRKQARNYLIIFFRRCLTLCHSYSLIHHVLLLLPYSLEYVFLNHSFLVRQMHPQLLGSFKHRTMSIARFPKSFFASDKWSQGDTVFPEVHYHWHLFFFVYFSIVRAFFNNSQFFDSGKKSFFAALSCNKSYLILHAEYQNKTCNG